MKAEHLFLPDHQSCRFDGTADGVCAFLMPRQMENRLDSTRRHGDTAFSNRTILVRGGALSARQGVSAVSPPRITVERRWKDIPPHICGLAGSPSMHRVSMFRCGGIFQTTQSVGATLPIDPLVVECYLSPSPRFPAWKDCDKRHCLFSRPNKVFFFRFWGGVEIDFCYTPAFFCHVLLYRISLISPQSLPSSSSSEDP